MAIQITQWTPDTCPSSGCVVNYSWDDSVPQDSRVHTFSSFVKKCLVHSTLSDQAAYAALIDENPRKNRTLELLRANIPSLSTTDINGNSILKPGLVTWSFDSNRVLQISVPSIVSSLKSPVQALANTQFGAGKVVIS